MRAHGHTQELFPNPSKLSAIRFIPMSTADCEGGLSALLCIEIDASNHFSSKVLNCLMTIVIEGPLIDKFNFDEAC